MISDTDATLEMSVVRQPALLEPEERPRTGRALALAAATFLLAPWRVPLTAPGLGEHAGRGPEMQHLAVKLTRLMLVAPIPFSVSGMISGILNARQRFLLSGLAPMLYNAAIILG